MIQAGHPRQRSHQRGGIISEPGGDYFSELGGEIISESGGRIVSEFAPRLHLPASAALVERIDDAVAALANYAGHAKVSIPIATSPVVPT